MLTWSTLSRMLSAGWPFRSPTPTDSPTTCFYLLNALSDLVAGPGQPATAARPIRRLGPYTFAAGDRLIVVRYITGSELTLIRARRWQRIDYVIDDMLASPEALAGVPADYAGRLRRFSTSLLPGILELSPCVLAPSQAILDLFPGLDRELLDPCLPALLVPTERLAHHEPGSRATAEPLRLCFLATRSHAPSLPLIAQIGRALGDRMPEARLTLFFGPHLPVDMAAMPALDNRRPLAWPAFQALVAEARFHIALAPLTPSRFDAGRSITKVLDHATVGAAGIYSDRPPFRESVEHGTSGLLVSNGAQDWIDAIVALAADRARMAALARGGLLLANQRGDPARVRAFWLQRLGLV